MAYIQQGRAPNRKSYCEDVTQQLEFLIAFGLLAAIAFLCTLRAIQLVWSKKYLRKIKTVFYLFPFACLVNAIENTMLASCTYISSDGQDLLKQRIFVVVIVLQTTQVPICLMATFEICYLIHKRRSVNFCGMMFDEGHRVKIISSRIRSMFFRNFIQCLAALMLAVGLIANFNLFLNEDDVSDLAGRTGWQDLLDNNNNLRQEFHLVLSFLPVAILIVVGLYLSYQLWRYGTISSMIIHTTYFNLWAAPFFGTIGLSIGQFFPRPWYHFTSNLGFVIFIMSLILVMFEVDKDMIAYDDFADFLHEVRRVADADDMSRRTPLNDSISLGKPKHSDEHKDSSKCISTSDGIEIVANDHVEYGK